MMDVKKVQELVSLTKRIEADSEKAKALRAELKDSAVDGECVTYDGYSVERKVVNSTITDANILVKNGFDVTRVTVQTTKIDPNLVKTIGVAEGKAFCVSVPMLYVTKEKK